MIASPPPLHSWRRDVISGGKGFYALNGEALPGTPLDRCDLEGARRTDSQVDAMLTWSRTPFVVPTEDGRFMLNDARYYDPLSRGRFGVQLPDGACTTSAAAFAGE
ncbi:hypothetical protein J4558_16835 [Leptolyngbya sp. 15MV]|nr:hypothetical protein J4558_16835 [Leptolyngbya sp. 15MV]